MNRLLTGHNHSASDSWPGEPGEPGEMDKAQTARVGLRILLAVISSLFLLFLLAFILRAQVPDWQPLTDPMAPLADPWLLWLNSALLACASISLHWARLAARREQAQTTLIAFALGGVLAFAFLAGQLLVWQQFAALGYLLANNPANSFFYLLTGLHGLHLFGGLCAWGRTLGRLLSGVPLTQLSSALELCATYWHYLLGLWLLLFALLVSSPQTYEAIAALCGLR